MSDGKKSDTPFDPSDFDFGASPESGGNDVDFDFGVEDMPSPGDKSNSKPVFAQPVDDGGFGDDDEFGAVSHGEDVVTDFGDPEVDTGFAPAGDDFGGGTDSPGFLNEDYVADNAEGAEFAAQGDDVFAEGGNEEVVVVEETVEVVPGDDRSFLQKHMFTLVCAGVGVLLLGVGYSAVAPMLTNTAPVQQDIVVSTQTPGSMPTGPVSTPSETPPFLEQSTAPSLPGAPTPLPPAEAPVETAEPIAVAQPESDNVETPDFQPPTEMPSYISDGNGSTPTAEMDAAVDDRVADLEGQISLLNEQISALTDRLAQLEAVPAAPATPEPIVSPVDKPAVVEGWVLRGVQGDVAWIEDAGGEFLEVSVGTDVPNAGRVTNIQMYEGDWLVVTQNGVIMQN